ncbi:mpv17-like protein 2 [Mizuhopecten yessoensis]|uniref:mpv17-like protein 2 n=1 Tax=Mizuhopecten yessoensis TaxID=6573 RepID=UPI000B457169|nr:mpv17-like protein 2 [Mizuhopecten yessoensis]
MLSLRWLKKLSQPVQQAITKSGKVIFGKKCLLVTNVTITVGMSCTGDFLQQRYQIKTKETNAMNLTRSRHVAASGLVIGPFCHYWYLFLDKWLPGKTLKIVLKKVMVDQVICSPIYISLFLVTTCMLEKKSWNEIKEETTSKGATLYMAEWIVWPPAQLFNFLILPTRFRVLYDNTISLGFDCYFSRVKYGCEKNEDPK